MSDLAKKLNVVLPISFFERDNNAYFNSIAVIDADGAILGKYRKSHIPDGPGYLEKYYFNPGNTGFKVWETKFGKIGIGICWDQWFPEAARIMALKGAEILFYPTAIGDELMSEYDSSGAWQRVMQGHAAANIIPVVASNRVGSESVKGQTNGFYGRSFICDRSGKILEEASKDKEEIIVAEINTEEVSSNDTALLTTNGKNVEAKYPGKAKIINESNGNKTIVIATNKTIEDEYKIPANARVLVDSNTFVQAGSQLTEGAIDPQEILSIRGPEAVQVYLVDEVQSVYKSQGVNINDIHIEVIVRQMMRKVKVQDPGDSNLLPNELADKWNFEKMNTDIAVAGGKPATAIPVLMGVTKASLSTESFLAAASFQETTRVLTEAAISGAVDPLYGLKENVIIGKLIPAKAEITVEIPEQIPEMQLPESIMPVSYTHLTLPTKA